MLVDQRESRRYRLLGCMLLVLLGCRPSPRDAKPSASSSSLAQQSSNDSETLFGDDLMATSQVAEHRDRHPLRWVDVAAETGLQFIYHNGAVGRSLMVEAMGGGVGAIDYDLDGRIDLLFSQGGDPTLGDDPTQPPVSLFRHTESSSPIGRRFSEVAESAGLGHYGYGQGVSVGDFNADGFEDAYFTTLGANTLLQNQGDGTFRNVTIDSGTAGDRWSTSAAWADLNGDGLLDLYVCNYLQYDPKHPRICRNAQGELRICHPREIQPWPNDCFINAGDGTFLEQSVIRGLVGEGSKSLGVVVADFDIDGAPDIYVANDTTANFLFCNRGDGNFVERALLQGCAVNYEGLFQASMGLAAGDFDRNGFLDLYSTHYYDESNTLYRNNGVSGFQDVTGRMGLHTPTLQSLGFGTVMADFDSDGWLDLFVTNGHVENYVDNPILEMMPQLFQFDGTKFHDVSLASGEFFSRQYVGRGVAAVDFDDDGDVDLAVVHQNGPAALLRNDSPQGRWLKLSLVGTQSPRQGIGCRVTVTIDGDRSAEPISHVRELVGGGSYLSSHQANLIFGLGHEATVCDVDVHWPTGIVQQLRDVDVNQSLVITEPSP